MRIIQCIATKGTLFNNTLIGFEDGVNVICGPSDSGKTLLLNSLCDSIWSSENIATDSSLWDDFLLNCIITLGGDEFRLIMEKSGRSITRLSDNKTIHSNSSESFLVSFQNTFPKLYRSTFGLGRDLFFSTCYAQSPVEENCYPKGFEELRSLVLGDMSAYYEKYCHLRDFFYPENIHNQLLVYTGRIKKELRESERELEIKEIRRTKFSKMKSESDSLGIDIDALENEKTELKIKHDAVAKLEKLKEEICKLLEENETLNGMLRNEKEKRGKLKSIEKVLKKSYPRFLKLKEDSKVLGGIERDFLDIQALLKRRLTLEEGRQKAKKTNVIRTVVLLLLAPLFSIGGFFSMIQLPEELYRQLLLGVPGGISFLALTSGFAMNAVYSRRYDSEELNASLDEKYSSIKKLLARTDIDTEGMGSDELYELILQFFQEFNLYSEQRDQLETVSDSIDPENEASIKSQEEENRKAIEKLEKEFSEICSDLSLETSEPVNFNCSAVFAQIDQEIEEKNSEIQKIQVLQQEMKSELLRFSDTENEDDSLTQEYELKKANYDQLIQRVQSVNLTLDLMKQCIERREKSLFEGFTEEAFKVFTELSGGKTSLDSLQMYQRVLSKPLEQVFPKPSLRQIFLLSMKLALTDFISVSGEKLPLILDEPCVYMDKKKIEIVLKYIEVLAEKRQIIILTHDQETYRRFGRQIEIS